MFELPLPWRPRLANTACPRVPRKKLQCLNRRPQINDSQSALRQPNTGMMQDGHPLPCIPAP